MKMRSLSYIDFFLWVAMAISPLSLASAFDTPPAEETAPIIIPPSFLGKNDFAQSFAAVYDELKNYGSSKQGQFTVEALLGGDDEKSKEALAALSHSTKAVAGLGTLTRGDLANLYEFYRYRDYALLIQKINTLLNGNIGQGIRDMIPETVSPILDTLMKGVADFVYNRAREEALSYLADRLYGLFSEDEVKFYFPNLSSTLGNLDTGFSLSSMGVFLSNAAKRDLALMPDRVLVYLLHQVIKEQGKEPERETLFAARMGFAFYNAVAKGRSPVDVARALYSIEYAEGYDPAPELRKRLGIASAVLDAAMRQKGWNIVNPTNYLCFALGTFFELADMPGGLLGGIEFADSDNKEKHIYKDQRDFDISDDTLQRVIPGIVDLIRESKDLYDFIGNAVNSMAEGNDGNGNGDYTVSDTEDSTGAQGQDVSTDSTKALRDYAVGATRALRLLGSIEMKILPLLGYNSWTDSSIIGKMERIAQLGEELCIPNNWMRVALASLNFMESMKGGGAESKEINKVLVSINKALPFVTTLAEAKKPEDIEKILISAAVPPTHYLMKYKAPSFCLGALAGIGLGMEYVDIGEESWGCFSGAFAPIGLSMSVPVSNYFHLGGFISLINIGSLISARFSSDIGTAKDGTVTEVSDSPKVDYLNLVTPGLFISLGILRSPFVLGMGCQVLPSRVVEKTDNDGTRSVGIPAIQFLGYIAVDVPIISF